LIDFGFSACSIVFRELFEPKNDEKRRKANKAMKKKKRMERQRNSRGRAREMKERTEPDVLPNIEVCI